MTDDRIEYSEFFSATGLQDWRSEYTGACVCYRTGSLAAGAELAQAIAALPGTEDGRPDIDIRSDAVFVRIITFTDEYSGLTKRDVELAQQITATAQRLNLTADPSAVQALKVNFLLDTDWSSDDQKAVVEFWRAALGYRDAPRHSDVGDPAAIELIDPKRRQVPIGFERVSADLDNPDGFCAGDHPVHLHVQQPMEVAVPRIEAAEDWARDVDEGIPNSRLADRNYVTLVVTITDFPEQNS
ncbi:4a-hydroxytetrahydrobiopterin dehydratase [Nocardia sp. NPDC052112]|uniref:4a-hydroxytetrahydrobiopterin dehydratase n=1 Tax=Nocardia sp. NPDC052112 TaxID=3155646 RepID=UPI0034416423